MRRFIALFALCFASGLFATVTEQTISCHEVDKDGEKLANGRGLKMTLTGELSSLDKVNFTRMSDKKVRAFRPPVKTATLVTSGVWKKEGKLGKGKFWEVDMLGKAYWNQHGNKPTMTVAFDDESQDDINYRFYMNTDQLGKNYEKETGYLWIDPDAPEGGGWPVDLICSSKAD